MTIIMNKMANENNKVTMILLFGIVIVVVVISSCVVVVDSHYITQDMIIPTSSVSSSSAMSTSMITKNQLTTTTNDDNKYHHPKKIINTHPLPLPLLFLLHRQKQQQPLIEKHETNIFDRYPINNNCIEEYSLIETNNMWNENILSQQQPNTRLHSVISTDVVNDLSSLTQQNCYLTNVITPMMTNRIPYSHSHSHSHSRITGSTTLFGSNLKLYTPFLRIRERNSKRVTYASNNNFVATLRGGSTNIDIDDDNDEIHGREQRTRNKVSIPTTKSIAKTSNNNNKKVTKKMKKKKTKSKVLILKDNNDDNDMYLPKGTRTRKQNTPQVMFKLTKSTIDTAKNQETINRISSNQSKTITKEKKKKKTKKKRITQKTQTQTLQPQPKNESILSTTSSKTTLSIDRMNSIPNPKSGIIGRDDNALVQNAAATKPLPKKKKKVKKVKKISKVNKNDSYLGRQHQSNSSKMSSADSYLLSFAETSTSTSSLTANSISNDSNSQQPIIVSTLNNAKTTTIASTTVVPITVTTKSMTTATMQSVSTSSSTTTTKTKLKKKKKVLVKKIKKKKKLQHHDTIGSSTTTKRIHDSNIDIQKQTLQYNSLISKNTSSKRTTGSTVSTIDRQQQEEKENDKYKLINDSQTMSGRHRHVDDSIVKNKHTKQTQYSTKDKISSSLPSQNTNDDESKKVLSTTVRSSHKQQDDTMKMKKVKKKKKAIVLSKGDGNSKEAATGTFSILSDDTREEHKQNSDKRITTNLQMTIQKKAKKKKTKKKITVETMQQEQQQQQQKQKQSSSRPDVPVQSKQMPQAKIKTALGTTGSINDSKIQIPKKTIKLKTKKKKVENTSTENVYETATSQLNEINTEKQSSRNISIYDKSINITEMIIQETNETLGIDSKIDWTQLDASIEQVSTDTNTSTTSPHLQNETVPLQMNNSNVSMVAVDIKSTSSIELNTTTITRHNILREADGSIGNDDKVDNRPVGSEIHDIVTALQLDTNVTNKLVQGKQNESDLTKANRKVVNNKMIDDDYFMKSSYLTPSLNSVIPVNEHDHTTKAEDDKTPPNDLVLDVDAVVDNTENKTIEVDNMIQQQHNTDQSSNIQESNDIFSSKELIGIELDNVITIGSKDDDNTKSSTTSSDSIAQSTNGDLTDVNKETDSDSDSDDDSDSDSDDDSDSDSDSDDDSDSDSDEESEDDSEGDNNETDKIDENKAENASPIDSSITNSIDDQSTQTIKDSVLLGSDESDHAFINSDNSVTPTKALTTDEEDSTVKEKETDVSSDSSDKDEGDGSMPNDQLNETHGIRFTKGSSHNITGGSTFANDDDNEAVVTMNGTIEILPTNTGLASDRNEANNSHENKNDHEDDDATFADNNIEDVVRTNERIDTLSSPTAQAPDIMDNVPSRLESRNDKKDDEDDDLLFVDSSLKKDDMKGTTMLETHTESSSQETNKRPVKGKTTVDVDVDDDDTNNILVSLVTWNLAEESPSEEDASFIKRFRKTKKNIQTSSGSERRTGMKSKMLQSTTTGSDLVLISAQECENIKPRRTEGRRSREYRRLMIQMLGKNYVPIALHLLGGIQCGLFCKRQFLDEVEHVSIADVTCGIGNVFHNKGGIGAFVQLKARSQRKGNDNGGALNNHAKSIKILFVAAHMAAHVQNSEARDSDFWRIVSELESQAPDGFLTSQARDTVNMKPGTQLLDSMDYVFFCGDLNYRIDLPRESVEYPISQMFKLRQMIEKSRDPAIVSKLKSELQNVIQHLLIYDQLKTSIIARSAFPGFSEGCITFPPTFKYDKHTDHYDTSHKQRIPAWTDRILFKAIQSSTATNEITATTAGTVRVIEYDSIQSATHSDHRPVFGTYSISTLGKAIIRERKLLTKKRVTKKKKTLSTKNKEPIVKRKKGTSNTSSQKKATGGVEATKTQDRVIVKKKKKKKQKSLKN